MFIEIFQIHVEYSRPSKNGKIHTYFRKHDIARLLCDSCKKEFERRVSQMDHRRLTYGYTHVCPNCNPKKFAQQKGVEARHFWNTTVDLDVDLNSV